MAGVEGESAAASGTRLTYAECADGEFRLKNQGCLNYAVSVKRNERSYVFRIRKAHAANPQVDTELSVLHKACAYYEFIAANNLISTRYLCAPKIVRFDTVLSRRILEALHMSPHTAVGDNSQLCALEFIDLTAARRPYFNPTRPVVTVELKPKQGYCHNDKNARTDVCTNCAAHAYKSAKGAYVGDVYKYCPLDLYSGDYSRTICALRYLFDAPRHNFRIYVDGEVRHSDTQMITEQQFNCATLLNRFSTCVGVKESFEFYFFF